MVEAPEYKATGTVTVKVSSAFEGECRAVTGTSYSWNGPKPSAQVRTVRLSNNVVGNTGSPGLLTLHGGGDRSANICDKTTYEHSRTFTIPDGYGFDSLYFSTPHWPTAGDQANGETLDRVPTGHPRAPAP